VPLALQSDYRSVAEYLAWSNPRVVSFSQYLLTDPAPLAGPSFGRYVFQMGLYLWLGHRAKPALDGFRTPLVVRRSGRSGVSLWGLVRPALASGGAVTVEYLDPRGSAWSTAVSGIRLSASGYWSARGSYRFGRHWRVLWTDPATGVRYMGPATAAYSF
jgi:hypothetical protein